MDYDLEDYVKSDEYLKRQRERQIERDPNVLNGEPQIRGMSVAAIFLRFLAGASVMDIRRAWNHLTVRDVETVIRHEILRRNANQREDYYPMVEKQ